MDPIIKTQPGDDVVVLLGDGINDDAAAAARLIAAGVTLLAPGTYYMRGDTVRHFAPFNASPSPEKNGQ